MARNNTYLESAEGIRGLFGDYLSGEGPCIALAIAKRPFSAQMQNAIQSSLRSFGYGSEACTFATIRPTDATVEGGDVALDSQALFLLIEGLDPICLICADAETLSLLAQAYRLELNPNSAAQVFGRPAVLFEDFEQMLETDAGKQRAWRLLKALPKR